MVVLRGLKCVGLLLCAVVMIVCVRVEAQVGPQLLLSPWAEHEHWVASDDQPVFIVGNETEGGADIDMVYYPSRGKVKFDKASKDPKWTLGYKFDAIVVDNKIGIPGDLNDLAVAVGYSVGEIADDWTLDLGVGVGTANDGHWDNEDSWYALADAAATWRMDENKIMVVGLSFDGNRNVFPDAPLPFIQFTHYYSQTFQYRLGLINGVTWRPRKDIELKADLGSLFNDEVIGIDAKATWFVTEKFHVFGEFENVRNGFYQEGQGHERMFYMANFIDAGVRYIVNEGIDLSGGIGWAFNQRFATGFDIRDLTTVAEPEDHMLFFLRLKGTF
ncbi:hypothetical protein [Poriferisphaera sp. WC338]|uniref:hypothetical protein n=1 Tax=Poriferisphaera sp. WC338 TaxID=3425129 RepID=UPI003D8175EE